MKFNFLGDSITAGAGAEKVENMFTYLVSEYFGAEEINLGVGGTRIAKQITKTNNPDDDVFMNRAVKMHKDADFTFVFGGTNDFGHGDAKLGEFGSKDDYTFYGATTNLVEYCVNNFDRQKLCFIIPLPRHDQEDPYGDGSKNQPIAPLSTYISIQKEILAHYGVEWLDLSEYFPTPTAPARNELFMDGLHPNPVGYKLLADKIIEYMLAKGFKKA